MTTRLTTCFLSLAGFLIIIGCNKPNKPSQGEATNFNDTLKSRYDTLNSITPPVKITWSYWSAAVRNHMDLHGPIKSSSILENPWAKIFESKNYKAIIFVSTDETGAPALITVDNNDNPIDTVFLLGDISNNDTRSRTSELCEITSERAVHLVDSISVWQLDSNGSRILNSKVTTIEENTYRILESGEIEELK